MTKMMRNFYVAPTLGRVGRPPEPLAPVLRPDMTFAPPLLGSGDDESYPMIRYPASSCTTWPIRAARAIRVQDDHFLSSPFSAGRPVGARANPNRLKWQSRTEQSKSEPPTQSVSMLIVNLILLVLDAVMKFILLVIDVRPMWQREILIACMALTR